MRSRLCFVLGLLALASNMVWTQPHAQPLQWWTRILCRYQPLMLTGAQLREYFDLDNPSFGTRQCSNSLLLNLILE